MKQVLILLITVFSLLFTGCGSAASGASAVSGTSSVSAASASSGTAAVSEVSASSGTSDTDIMEIDEGLRVVLAEIMDMVHPGEAGASLKSAQAAADALDFALGTDLDSETLREMTKFFYECLHEAAAEEFPEQLQCVSDVLASLQSEEGESILTDAGITDSSYPWTDDAFKRVEAIVQACSK